ncbi:tail assembly chaperone [Gordonia phage Phendrix]|uniref:Tail assembly chaperone n=2 Tax=Godonkavirus TaxID=2733178 RepID=A0A4D6E2G9_9CAUD|nr:tail assembly chaperone [Gordonia phage GodonK]YP_010649128.1 tail assembly chaperone [Gordonia phage Phendrix]QBZ72704.1 tail assembly chaperone [Gordonia phage GodonK]QDK02631.1 tail assembly chaperone [Gordonia phage Phendrix]
MRNRRKFGSNIPLPVEGLELELNDQVFKVRGEMSGARLLKVVADMDGDNEAASARAMLEFLESSFLLEDRERGMDYLYNSDPPIGFDTLQEIIEWLIESYTKKATEQSPQSSAGQTVNTGPTITELPLETASTYSVPPVEQTSSSQYSSAT